MPPSGSESDPVSLRLTPDVTTSSSTDVRLSDSVTSSTEDSLKPARLEMHLFCTACSMHGCVCLHANGRYMDCSNTARQNNAEIHISIFCSC